MQLIDIPNLEYFISTCRNGFGTSESGLFSKREREPHNTSHHFALNPDLSSWGTPAPGPTCPASGRTGPGSV